MYFIKVVLISLVLLIKKNSSAQPEGHITDQNEVEKCSSDKKVCGTDGKTYSNICLLQKETGVKLAHEGDCARRGKKKTAYRPDLILKSKIADNTEESLQKKLVKHFNPTTGKWEYVVEILPTIVITPTFHHLEMINDDHKPSTYNVINRKTKPGLKTVGAVNASNELNINNLPSPSFAKISAGTYPEKKLIINSSQGPDNIITEIVGNVTNNFTRSQVENGVLVQIKNETIPSFNTSIIHPNRSHPSVFPSRETGKKTGEKSPLYQFQTELNEPKSLDVKFGSGKIPAKEKQLTFNGTNQTNLQEPLSGNSILRPNLVATLPPSTLSISDLLKPSFKDALLKDNSIDNHSNEVQPRKNQTLPVKLNNTTDFRINGSLYTKNNEMPRTFHGKATKIPQINASNIPSQILNYKPHNYHQIPKRTNLGHHHSYKPKSLHHHPRYPDSPLLNVPRLVIHRDFEPNNTNHEIKDVVKTKNVSSPYPTTTGKVTHTKRNNSQSIINNMTNTTPFKLPGDHEELVNIAPRTGFTAVPVFPTPNISIPIWNVPGPQITIPIQNEPIPHPKEDYDHQVWNVSQLTGEEPVIATPPMDDSHGPMVNISQPITNITGLKDLSMKVNLHRDSEPKINIVLKTPHKNLSSPHPTTMDNTTHTALNISQPIMNNLTLGTLSPKIPEDHQKLVTNVSELLGKETVPPITPVKDSALNISQPITNITGLKGLPMKVNLHRDSEPKINIVLKPPHKNVSSPHPTTMDNTTHTALNISQPIMNNLTLGTLSPKIPEDHQKLVTNVSELLGKETVPPITPVKDSALNISQPITDITGLKDLPMKVNLHRDSEPKINIVLKPPHKNVSSPHPTTMDNTTHTALNISQPIMNNLTLGTLSPKIPEDHQKPVTNVSELLGKETVPPIIPVKDSAMNISQPITNITGLKDLSMKVNLHRDSEPKINIVLKPPHKNVSSPHPTTIDNTTHTALNISQPIMNNLTLGTLSPKIPEDDQKPVTNVSELLGKETVPPITPVKDSALNISQPITNITGLKDLPMKVNLHRDSEPKINIVLKPPHKNVSSPHPTTMDNTTHTALNISQPIMNNLTLGTLSPKIPEDHQKPVTNVSELLGKETVPPITPVKDSAINISQPITNITGLKDLSMKVNLHRDSEPKINIVLKPPHKNVSSPHSTTMDNTTHTALNISQPIMNNLTLGTLSPKIPEEHQKPVTNVSELLGKETVPPITPVKDSAINISQPITNITGLNDLSMKVNLHRDSEPKINIVLKPPHKNMSSPHPTTMDNTTHTALNISQPIMNNLTLGTLSRKIPEDHQKPVTNVSELLGKETVPPTTPVKDSAINISQLITNITGLKYLSMKDEYNPVRNTSQPIKKGPVSGDHPSGKLNIIPAPKKTEEIPKIMPNNGPNTHQIQPSFHSGYSNLTHSAARVPKLHGLIPPKHTPSIIENKGENTDQTKPNIDTKPESNTKWGTYYIKLPGNVSDNIDLVINWEILQLKTNQPNLMINVSEVVGSKNYTWPKDSKYATDTSIYHKLRSGSLKPINEKIKRVVNNDVWHNTNSRHPQFLVNTRKTGDVPINVTKTTEIKTYQLEDEVTLKENRKSGLLQNRKESKLGAYRYVSPLLQLPRSNKFGHNLEKYGSYSLDLPRNVAGNFKLIFTWTLRNKLPKSMRSPIDVTEKQVKYDYKWKIGGNNEGEKPTGNEEIQPIRSVNVTSHKSATPIKHSFGEKRLTGRKSPGRRLHDLAQGLRNVHLDIPKTTTKPQIDTTSAPVKTEEITPAGTKLYPGWYYMEMLFNVPGGGGGCSANNNNCTNLNNYNDTRKSQIDPTDLSSFNKSRLSLLPMDYPSFLDKYAFVRAKAHQGKCNCNNDKTKK